jgi:DnaJ like chaperone protein
MVINTVAEIGCHLARAPLNTLPMAFLRKIASLVARRPLPKPTTQADCGCPETLPERDPAFTSAITALGAKLLRKDRRGANAAFESFNAVFPAAPESGWQVRKFFGLAGKSQLGVDGYAEQIARRYRYCPKVLERSLDGLFSVAKSDGVVTGEEMAILERVSTLFGVTPLGFRRLKARHLGRGDDPYTVLRVEPDASDDAVHSAWKSAVVALHPDRLTGRGESPEIVANAETATKNLNAAYEEVMRERASLARKAA